MSECPVIIDNNASVIRPAILIPNRSTKIIYIYFLSLTKELMVSYHLIRVVK